MRLSYREAAGTGDRILLFTERKNAETGLETTRTRGDVKLVCIRTHAILPAARRLPNTAPHGQKQKPFRNFRHSTFRFPRSEVVASSRTSPTALPLDPTHDILCPIRNFLLLLAAFLHDRGTNQHQALRPSRSAWHSLSAVCWWHFVDSCMALRALF